MLVTGLTVKPKEKENILTQTEVHMKEIGIKINNMVRELKNGLMELLMRVNTLTD